MNYKRIQHDNNIIKLIELIKEFYIDELDLNIYNNYNETFKDYFFNIINDSDLIDYNDIKEIFLNNDDLIDFLKNKSYCNYRIYKKENKTIKEKIKNLYNINNNYNQFSFSFDNDDEFYNELLRILFIYIFDEE